MSDTINYDEWLHLGENDPPADLSREEATELFWVRLTFPGTRLAPFEVVPVARLPMPPSAATFHGTIGRDLLQRWDSLEHRGRCGRLILRDVPHWLVRWLPWS